MKTFVQKFWPDIADKAVAYVPEFTYMVYTPGNETHEKYFKSCCDSTKSLSVHNADFVVSKSNIKKTCFQLDYFYCGISLDLKEKIMNFGIDDKEEDVFRPIWSKEHNDPIAYSIEPCHSLKPIYKENDYNVETICKKCDVVWAYKNNSYGHSKYVYGDPIYIPEDVLDDFHDFNVTHEYFGPGGYLLRKVIVSKRIHDFILCICPRAEFRPVLVKEKPIETEEMIQKRIRQQRLKEWREKYKSKHETGS